MKFHKNTRFDVRLFYSEQDNLTSKLKDFIKDMTEKLILVLEYHQLIINKLMMFVGIKYFQKKTMKNLKMNYLILVVGFINLTINKDNLLKGINNFESLLRYINEPKIIKKQKRNDG